MGLYVGVYATLPTTLRTTANILPDCSFGCSFGDQLGPTTNTDHVHLETDWDLLTNTDHGNLHGSLRYATYYTTEFRYHDRPSDPPRLLILPAC